MRVTRKEVIIGKAGRPLVRLVPYRPDRAPRVAGAWRGKVRLAPDFDEVDDDLAAAFEGR